MDTPRSTGESTNPSGVKADPSDPAAAKQAEVERAREARSERVQQSRAAAAVRRGDGEAAADAQRGGSDTGSVLDDGGESAPEEGECGRALLLRTPCALRRKVCSAW